MSSSTQSKGYNLTHGSLKDVCALTGSLLSLFILHTCITQCQEVYLHEEEGLQAGKSSSRRAGIKQEVHRGKSWMQKAARTAKLKSYGKVWGQPWWRKLLGQQKGSLGGSLLPAAPLIGCKPNSLLLRLAFPLQLLMNHLAGIVPSEQPESKHPERYCSDKAGGSQDS